MAHNTEGSGTITTDIDRMETWTAASKVKFNSSAFRQKKKIKCTDRGMPGLAMMHLQKRRGGANAIIGCMNRPWCPSQEMLLLPFILHYPLEYCVQFWVPPFKKDMTGSKEDNEDGQRSGKQAYKQRLKELNMLNLEKRGLLGAQSHSSST